MVYGRRNEDDDGEVWKNDVGRRLIKSLEQFPSALSTQSCFPFSTELNSSRCFRLCRYSTYQGLLMIYLDWP